MVAPAYDVGGSCRVPAEAENVVRRSQAENGRRMRRQKHLCAVDGLQRLPDRFDRPRMNTVFRLLDQVDTGQIRQIGQQGERQDARVPCRERAIA